MALPNLWQLYNLQANPYFQDYLRETDPPTYPLELFVGRDEEVARLLRGIGGASSSRQMVAGPPGYGKTTLVQKVKEATAEEGYVTHPHPVGVYGGDDVGSLLVRILGYVYEATLGTLGAGIAEEEHLAEARQIVRASRIMSGSGGLSALGVGLSAGRSQSFVAPVAFDAPSTVFRLLDAIERLACRDHRRRGIVVHLNNFENLPSSTDYARAADVLRDVRDFFLLHNYHWIVVGTEEALAGTLLVHRQVESIFPTPQQLEPLTDSEFQQLLIERYRHLRLDERKLVVPPIADSAAIALYTLFRGDLRGALRALEEAAEALAGYAAEGATRSLEESEVLAALRPRYQAAFERDATAALLEQFAALRGVRDEVFTQERIAETWNVSRARVSQVLAKLRGRGYVREARRRGPQVFYELTGAARIILSP